MDRGGAPLEYQILSDTMTISIGGQTGVQPGQGVNINIADNDVLLFLDKTAIAFDLYVRQGYMLENALDLFFPQSFTLGKVSGSLGAADRYVHDKLMRTSRTKVARYARGLLMDLKGPSVGYANDGTSSYTAAVNAVAGASQYLGDLRERYGYQIDQTIAKGGVAIANHNLYRVVVPLHLLFRHFDLVPEKCLYLGLG